ncbi:MAG: hypothetical protein A3J73_06365 [Planctomycetes bacterium RIFCSPHIGHO2_02_FULL_38_41]|nr:MAG: hypothetical protein A3J73_06365 [Planctomycetes bacterium RIFCSPHIGHO2_02_FULL_38_41]OHB98085.1 MAG: hypothetical protein A2W74_07570 [Planctomycetes bacterium RIFCSPLOWO2_12_38_17]
MAIQINATRMEYLKLRRRLVIAVKGHKLLKDKNEGLMREFIVLLKSYKSLRQKVDVILLKQMNLFVLAQITASSDCVYTALEQSKGKLRMTISEKSILGVKVPVFGISVTESNAYSFLDTPVELDNAILQLREFFQDIVRVAEMEQSIRILAREIEKIRRRVNALEHILIPQLRDSIKFIKSKLDEMERSNIGRLMKIKEMLVSKEIT